PDPNGFNIYMANANTLYGATSGYTTEKNSAYNAYFGERAGCGIGHNYNTAMGYRALDTGAAPWGPTCNHNTVVGARALNKPGTGDVKVSYNVAVGTEAMRNCTLGSRNVAVGSDAGKSLTEGYDCTFIGHGAGSTGGIRRIAIGSGAQVTENDHCR